MSIPTIAQQMKLIALANNDKLMLSYADEFAIFMETQQESQNDRLQQESRNGVVNSKNSISIQPSNNSN